MLKYVCVCVCVCVHMPSTFLSLENQIIFIKIFQATIIIWNPGKKKKFGISMAPALVSNWYQVCQIYYFTHIKEFGYFLTHFLVYFIFFSEEESLMRYNTLLLSCVCMNFMPVIPPKCQIFSFLTLSNTNMLDSRTFGT